MAQPKNYITPRGYKRHRDEYQWLRGVIRPNLVEEVAAAAALGDRSENAEYIYGKKKLREVDGRLRFLSRRMGACEIVEPGIDRGDVVYFGATIAVAYPDGVERRFELVGEDEIDGDGRRISWRSPMGQALMRRREGDLVYMKLPQGGSRSRSSRWNTSRSHPSHFPSGRPTRRRCARGQPSLVRPFNRRIWRRCWSCR